MTKRFTIEPTMMRECIVDNFTGEQLDTVDYTERLCDLLNALHEENEQLTKEIEDLKEERDFYKGHCESEGLLYD